MCDDCEVLCYLLVVEQQVGGWFKFDFKDCVCVVWFVQKDGDEGCQLFVSMLFDVRVLKLDDVWFKLWLFVEVQCLCVVKQVVVLLGCLVEKVVVELQDNVGKYMSCKVNVVNCMQVELMMLMLLCVVLVDLDQVVVLMCVCWECVLFIELVVVVWVQIVCQVVFCLMFEVNDYFDCVLILYGKKGQIDFEWSDEIFVWVVCVVLCGIDGMLCWLQLLCVIGLLSVNEQNQQVWCYWCVCVLIVMVIDGVGGEL